MQGPRSANGELTGGPRFCGVDQSENLGAAASGRVMKTAIASTVAAPPGIRVDLAIAPSFLVRLSMWSPFLLADPQARRGTTWKGELERMAQLQGRPECLVAQRPCSLLRSSSLFHWLQRPDSRTGPRRRISGPR